MQIHKLQLAAVVLAVIDMSYFWNKPISGYDCHVTISGIDGTIGRLQTASLSSL